MIFSESFNLLPPNLVWWCIIISQIVFQKDWFVVFKVKVTVKDNQSTFWYIILTADPFATKLGLMLRHHKVECPVKRLDCSVVVKVKVTGNVQNSSECPSGQYFLSFLTFCNQTWYGGATLWAKVSCKKIGLLSSSSLSLWRLIWLNMTVYISLYISLWLLVVPAETLSAWETPCCLLRKRVTSLVESLPIVCHCWGRRGSVHWCNCSFAMEIVQCFWSKHKAKLLQAKKILKLLGWVYFAQSVNAAAVASISVHNV